ncbi:MAG: hypothetical protein KAG66_13540, partial [Methylococcales bacterium]|nr:hypothetical protein [Methylococcales bacterium]
YKAERLFENLMEQEPKLRLFLYSPSTNAIDFVAKAFPAVRPKPKLVDERPFMTPTIPANAPPLPEPDDQTWLLATMALLGVAVGLALLPRLHWRRYQFEIGDSISNS